MAEKIYIADKKTLDEVNENSKSILNNTKKYFLNNPEQLLYNEYKIFGISKKGVSLGESSYEEKEVISLESQNGGIFRFLDLSIAPSVKSYSAGYNCKNIKVKLIVDDIEYILTQANNISDNGRLDVTMDISSQGTLNQRLNKTSSELDFSGYEIPESVLYATDNTFSSILNQNKVKKFDNI
ncbi:hypothetical protein CBCST_14911 [Clostridium botulinum C str. Stockholm]|nr:hypothetical protein CBCST_14911 [Clostridium botulinum C str. Stockholm]